MPSTASTSTGKGPFPKSGECTTHRPVPLESTRVSSQNGRGDRHSREGPQDEGYHLEGRQQRQESQQKKAYRPLCKSAPKQNCPNYEMTSSPPTGEQLPIYAFRRQIIDHINHNSITCIQGETGCGKSTKVPQFLLEDALQKSKKRRTSPHVNIAVTQPRRIACIALAKRVAWEMGEELGRSVGFRISGESLSSQTTNLTFMTTGYFLQVLVNDPDALSQYTHIILDEVHERNVDADLLSLVVKLQKASFEAENSQPPFKIVVMSATLQGNLFSSYFSTKGCDLSPTIFVGAKRFNVDALYLDDFVTRPSKDSIPVQSENSLGTLETKSSLAPDLLSINGFRDFRLSEQCQRFLKAAFTKFNNAAHLIVTSKNRRGGSARSRKAFEPIIMEGLDLFVLDLVRHFGVAGESVLVFLPGIGEITDLYETLSQLEMSQTNNLDGLRPNRSQTSLYPSRRGDSNMSLLQGESGLKRTSSANLKIEGRHFRLFVLHSLVSREEQEAVFNEPEKDTVHIILASNVAESSLTLPKVRLVIDFCLRRQLIYDERRHASSLVKTWASHASSQQRLGRTGRVFPGICVRLVSRIHYDECMEPFDLPEMLTAPLEKLYLQTKQLGYRLAKSFSPSASMLISRGLLGSTNNQEMTFTSSQLLQLTVQPPATDSITRTIDALDEIGALSSNTEDAMITTLGRVAMHLPLDVRLSRLLFYSILLSEPVDGVILAACLSSHDPFTLPSHLIISNPKFYTNALQRSLRTRAAFDAGNFSEPLMLRNLFVEWLLHLQTHFKSLNRRVDIRLEMTKCSKLFSQSHSVVPKRLVHLSTSVVEIGTRLRRLLHPRLCSRAVSKLNILLNLLSNENEFEAFVCRDRVDVSSVLSRDPLFLKALLAISFSPQFVIGAPSVLLPSHSTAKSLPENMPRGLSKSSKKKENMLRLMASESIDPSRSIVIPKLPPLLSSIPVLTALLKLILSDNIDFELKIASDGGKHCAGIVTFPPTKRNIDIEPATMTKSQHCSSALRSVDNPDIPDDFRYLPLVAHVLNQFGGGRWEFPAPIPLDLPLPKLLSNIDGHEEGTDSDSDDEADRKVGMDERSIDALGSTNSPNPSRSPQLNGGMSRADYYHHGVMMCQPTNPCLVKWKILGFWMVDEIDEMKASFGGCKKKKNSNTLVEIEGKCNYRNPIGFLTSYPRNFREDQSRVESSVNERSHELILGVFATQQGTDMPKLSRIEGVTILPSSIATLLMLACVRHRFDMKFCIRSHAVEGATITGIKLSKSNQEIPVSIWCSGTPKSYSSPITPLSLESLVHVNHFRKALSDLLERAETLASAEAIEKLLQQSQLSQLDNRSRGDRRRRMAEAEACVFIDSNPELVQAMNQILSDRRDSPSPSISKELLTSSMKNLLGDVSIEDFIEDVSALTPHSYGGRGQILITQLSALSNKKLSSLSTTPVFGKSSDDTKSPFLEPLCIAGVAESVRVIRNMWLDRIQADSEKVTKKQRKKEGKAKAREEQSMIVRQYDNQLRELAAQGVTPPANMRNPKTIRKWMEEQLGRTERRENPHVPWNPRFFQDPAIVSFQAQGCPSRSLGVSDKHQRRDDEGHYQRRELQPYGSSEDCDRDTIPLSVRYHSNLTDREPSEMRNRRRDATSGTTQQSQEQQFPYSRERHMDSHQPYLYLHSHRSRMVPLPQGSEEYEEVDQSYRQSNYYYYNDPRSHTPNHPSPSHRHLLEERPISNYHNSKINRLSSYQHQWNHDSNQDRLSDSFQVSSGSYYSTVQDNRQSVPGQYQQNVEYQQHVQYNQSPQ